MKRARKKSLKRLRMIDERTGKPIPEVQAVTRNQKFLVGRDPYSRDWLLYSNNGDGTWTWTYGWGPTAKATALKELEFKGATT